MKKKLAGLVAAMMVLAVGTTAFASPTGTAVQGGTVTVDGKKVDVIISTQIEDSKANAESAEKAAKDIPSIDVASAEVLGVVDVKLPPTVAAASKENPVPITFNVAAAKKGDKIAVLHWNGQSWDTVDVVTVTTDSVVTAKFTSLSPVAFVKVTEKATTPSGSGNNGSGKPTSPPGGETAPILPILAIVCLAGVVVCGKKVKFNA